MPTLDSKGNLVNKIILDRSQLLGFDVAGNLQAKVGAKGTAPKTAKR